MLRSESVANVDFHVLQCLAERPMTRQELISKLTAKYKISSTCVTEFVERALEDFEGDRLVAKTGAAFELQIPIDNSSSRESDFNSALNKAIGIFAIRNMDTIKSRYLKRFRTCGPSIGACNGAPSYIPLCPSTIQQRPRAANENENPAGQSAAEQDADSFIGSSTV